MSVSCPDCGAVASYGHEIGHKTDCSSLKKPFDFKTLRRLTPDEKEKIRQQPKRPRTSEEEAAFKRMLTGQPDPNTTVTIYLPPGYHSAEEFAEDCGFELASPSRG